MSIYDKASLVQIPSGYKSGTLYSVVPNTADGDFTVTGDPQGEATRVNKDGLIETVSANVPRLNYDPTNPQDPHLLLEPTRTNNATYSNDISSWASVGSPTITTNITVAPDGSNTADGLQDATGGSFKRITRTISVSGNSTYTGSFFVKKETSETAYGGIMLDFINGTRRSAWVIFDAVNGTANNTTNSTLTPTIDIEDFGNYWRFSVTATDTGNNTSLIFAYFATMSTSSSGALTTGVGSVRTIWGAQLEAGSYPTSLIPTSGSAVTRTEDFCNIPSGLGNVLNTSEGTLFVDVEVPRVSSTGSFERITLSDQNASTDRILFDNFGGNWRALMLSTAGNVNKTIVNVTANQRIKVAIAYSATSLRISYDGNTATTTSGSYTPTTTLESFKFSNKDGGSKWQGKIHQTIYFPTALTDSELQTLTT